MKTKLNAHDIQLCLAEKMSGTHICFSEVKDGPSWGQGKMYRMDFVAIKKTWSPVTVKAFEIKVSRSDFKADEKWTEYLDLCNQFYWVCPRGLIKKSEIDDRCGLITVNPKNNAVHTVHRALHRDVDPSPEMLLYLLMWRYNDVGSRDVSDDKTARRMRVEREMARNEDVGARYGRFVSQKLKVAQKKMQEIEMEAAGQISRVEGIIQWIDKHGYDKYAAQRILSETEELYLWIKNELRNSRFGVKDLLRRADIIESYHGMKREIDHATELLQSISRAVEGSK